MITLIVSSVDTQLRGYIALFLFEISTGTYVGKVNKRVREKLWEKVSTWIETKGGETCLVYPDNTSIQGFSVLLKNYPRETIDKDGIILLNKPNKKSVEYASNAKKKGWSKAYWRNKRR